MSAHGCALHASKVCTCVFVVFVSVLQCVAVMGPQKEDDGVKQICYYRNQKFACCYF